MIYSVVYQQLIIVTSVGGPGKSLDCLLLDPYSSQRLFTSIYSCSFSATERRVRFFFSIDIELDALDLMPEHDGLLWKYFGIGGGAMMLIRYKLV